MTAKSEPRPPTDTSKKKDSTDRPDHPRNEAEIDETVEESFPASDPPSWSSTTSAGAPPPKKQPGRK